MGKTQEDASYKLESKMTKCPYTGNLNSTQVSESITDLKVDTSQ